MTEEMKAEDLVKKGDHCLFRVKPYIHWADEKELEDGYVSEVYENGALIHYMYGVSSYSDLVKFDDIVIIGTTDEHEEYELSEQFSVFGFSGRGIILKRDFLQ